MEKNVAGRRRHKHNEEKDSRFCRVCGEQASNFNFGVLTCEACKAFFRRNASLNMKLKCSFAGKCMVTSSKKFRRRCSACRLKACLDQGMSLDFLRKVPQNRHLECDTASSYSSSSKECRSVESLREEVPECGMRTAAAVVEQYRMFAYPDFSLTLSAAQVVEIESLGNCIFTMMVAPACEPGHALLTCHWPPPIPKVDMTPTVESACFCAMENLLEYSDEIIRRLLIFIRNIPDISIWNLNERRLPFVKMRLLVIILPLFIPTYSVEDRCFVTHFKHQKMCLHPDRMATLIKYLMGKHGVSGDIQLTQYVDSLYKLLGNDVQLCALFCCCKLFLITNPICSLTGHDNEMLLKQIEVECLELFENYLFELCALIKVRHDDSYSERIALLLDTLISSTQFDACLYHIIINVPFSTDSMSLIDELLEDCGKSREKRS